MVDPLAIEARDGINSLYVMLLAAKDAGLGSQTTIDPRAAFEAIHDISK